MISVEATYNLKGITRTLKESGHEKYEIVELENVNHFFQRSDNDSIDRVYFNEETFSKVALEKIGNWLLKL